MSSNYSVDFIKKAAFVDELNNVLRVLEVEFPDQVDETIVTVMTYLESRIKQIEIELRSYYLGVGVGTRERLISALAADYRSRPGSNPGTPTKS